jgi:transient receptor potential cation channel subfamily C
MVTDIIKFFFLYVLVLFAFSAGLNQLLWWDLIKISSVNPIIVNQIFSRYYADLEKKKCPEFDASYMMGNMTVQGNPDPNACIVWRRFAK